jgi:hypothetical protein
MNIGEMALLWNDNNEQVSPISEGFVETRIIYVWLPFAKSRWGQNRSSTLMMKSWFHSDYSVVVVVLGYLILPLITTIA